LFLLQRRAEIQHMARGSAELARAKQSGSHRARLQHPVVDLSRCIGCGICVEACPEEGVLEMIHGQAVVVHGARCVGHARCATECPVGAIAVTLGDLQDRADIPVLTDRLESTRVPGLFLAGEVTGYALIRTAVVQGTAVADQVAERVERRRSRLNGKAQRTANDPVLDLCVVGAGPAGLACSLQAKARGLSFVTLEQATLGGTVSNYPRRKLVLTQPVTLPLHGKLTQSTYTKEELMELWARVAREQELPIRTGEELVGVAQAPDGHLVVQTRSGSIAARNVCLVLGRRGTPRKLGVPGEDMSKVAYSLLDAQSYSGRKILVVGGGDSAIEAALGLADQPGNRVTLAYRQAAFSRLKARNDAHLARAVKEKKLELLMQSNVTHTDLCVT
jgi:thioredoxin reductase